MRYTLITPTLITPIWLTADVCVLPIVGSAANSPLSCTSQGSRSRSRSIIETEPQSSRERGTGKRVGLQSSASTVASANRTKEETLHLIRLRDDMIEAKHREVSTYFQLKLRVFSSIHRACSANPCRASMGHLFRDNLWVVRLVPTYHVYSVRYTQTYVVMVSRILPTRSSSSPAAQHMAPSINLVMSRPRATV